METFLLGDIVLNWDGGGYELEKGAFFERFRAGEKAEGEALYFQGAFEDLDAYSSCRKLETHRIYDLYQVGQEHLLMYHWGRRKNAYAVWTDRVQSDAVNKCYFHPDILREQPMHMDWFLGVSGLHKALLQKQAPILHASYIDAGGEAILFSAPSQTGKSTQAELWRVNGGAEIINGDRVLLRKRAGVWHAFGFPCCGSSGICVNRTLPVRAIVILEQGKENRIVTMSVAEQVRSLVSATEVYRWDAEELEQSFQAAEDMAEHIPVFKLSCRPDAEAVEVLKTYLYEK